MGVFVKGMYLPPNCYFCPMTNDGFYLCKANNPHKQLEDDCEERRPNWCPLIPVPPHGDLIDCDAYRDEFMNGVYELCDDDSDNYRANAIIDLYDSAPTVIPASEEG